MFDIGVPFLANFVGLFVNIGKKVVCLPPIRKHFYNEVLDCPPGMPYSLFPTETASVSAASLQWISTSTVTTSKPATMKEDGVS